MLRRRFGFTLAELTFALVLVSGLSAVLIIQLQSARVRTQDRTIEQALVQLAGDTVRVSSYGDGVLSVEGFRASLDLPTSAGIFESVVDGDPSVQAGETSGPSVAYWQVSVQVSEDGSEAFLAARTFSDRCVLASVSRSGAVMVSRPLELAECRPQSGFVPEQTVQIEVPAWSGMFQGPAVAPGPAEAYVGWSFSDLDWQEGDDPIVLFVATARRSSGSAVAYACSVFAESQQPAGTTVGGRTVQYACTIPGLEPDVEYAVTLVALSDTAQSLPSRPSLVVPYAVSVTGVDGEATTGEVTIEWGIDIGGGD